MNAPQGSKSTRGRDMAKSAERVGKTRTPGVTLFQNTRRPQPHQPAVGAPQSPQKPEQQKNLFVLAKTSVPKLKNDKEKKSLAMSITKSVTHFARELDVGGGLSAKDRVGGVPNPGSGPRPGSAASAGRGESQAKRTDSVRQSGAPRVETGPSDSTQDARRSAPSKADGAFSLQPSGSGKKRNSDRQMHAACKGQKQQRTIPPLNFYTALSPARAPSSGGAFSNGFSSPAKTLPRTVSSKYGMAESSSSRGANAAAGFQTNSYRTFSTLSRPAPARAETKKSEPIDLTLDSDEDEGGKSRKSTGSKGPGSSGVLSSAPTRKDVLDLTGSESTGVDGGDLQKAEMLDLSIFRKGGKSKDDERLCTFLKVLYVGTHEGVMAAVNFEDEDEDEDGSLDEISARTVMGSVEAVGLGNYCMMAGDLKCLTEAEWLNDEVINGYLCLLTIRNGHFVAARLAREQAALDGGGLAQGAVKGEEGCAGGGDVEMVEKQIPDSEDEECEEEGGDGGGAYVSSQQDMPDWRQQARLGIPPDQEDADEEGAGSDCSADLCERPAQRSSAGGLGGGADEGDGESSDAGLNEVVELGEILNAASPTRSASPTLERVGLASGGRGRKARTQCRAEKDMELSPGATHFEPGSPESDVQVVERSRKRGEDGAKGDVEVLDITSEAEEGDLEERAGGGSKAKGCCAFAQPAQGAGEGIPGSASRKQGEGSSPEAGRKMPDIRQRPNCLFFSSFFYAILRNGKNGYSHDNVKRWGRKHDFSAYDHIFYPINVSNSHWTLAVVSPKLKKIQYLDSLGSRNRTCMELLERYMQDEGEHRGINALQGEWQHEFIGPPQIPMQGDAASCGLFVIAYADCISQGLSFEEVCNAFRQRDMADIRASVLWILKSCRMNVKAEAE